MRSLNIIITALLISTVLPGCSRIRQMTRRDYASMEDPFTSRLTDDDAIASKEVPPQGADPSGQFRTASQTRGITANADGQFAGAGNSGATDAGSGPSMSDFVQKADSEVVKARQSAAALGTSAKQAVDTDMAGMTQFLGEQATASGLTDTAEQLDEDFAQWAAMQKQEWASKAATVDDQASPFLNAANAARQSFNRARSASAGSAFDETLGGGFAESEVATPFIQQASGQRFGDAVNRASSADFAAPAAAPRIQAKAPVGMANPFDDLMQEGNAAAAIATDPGRVALEPKWDVTPVAPHEPEMTDPFISPSGGSTSRPKSLDSNFSFDTGWKPSDVVPR